MLLSLLCQF